MTAKQLILEEQSQCHGSRDGGHSTAEYHDSVILCYKQHVQRYNEKNLANRDTNLCKLSAPKVLVTVFKNLIK